MKNWRDTLWVLCLTAWYLISLPFIAIYSVIREKIGYDDDEEIET